MRKVLLLAIFGLIVGTINASPRIFKVNRGGRLLGSKECTWGPSFWCGSLANAKDCNAVSHCIQTVWEHQKPKVDNDGVCKICLDMVQQARDQLRSNETQEELKEVFEGSCALIHVKAIVKECDKLVDDFIPELIEALTSQMDPHVVCSVAGLCNNAHIDRLLLEHEAEAIKKIEKPELTCDRCHSLVDKMHDKFHASRENDVLNTLLYVCGTMGSFSDSCSNIMLTYFKDIYQHMESSFTGQNVCHIAGVCSARFHTHETKAIEGIEITPLSAVGVVEIESDDLPCDLCKQLVNHLKDILIANTTEIEFKEVMEGLCKQTGSFKKECISLVDEYYDKAYQFLVSELDPSELCALAEICPKNVALGGPWKSIAQADTPIWPLLSAEVAAFTLKTYSEQQKPRKLSTGPKLSASEINAMQLPPSRYMPQVLIDEPKRYCVFCEYFLHFVQEAISSPKNEDEIKKVVERLCDKLPSYVTGQCKDFVSVYGDAFIALFVQEIDPSKVCPGLKVCSQKEEVRNVEVFMHPLPNDKSTCPMCLLAITTIENQIKSNKSKAAIENALNNLCKHLPQSLSPECTDLVESYYNEIIEMLVKEFNPQEVCVYIKFCTDTKPDTSLLEVVIPITKSVQQQKDLDIMTNEIQDNTVNGIPKSIANKDNISEKPTCPLCEYVMHQVQKQLKDKATEKEIIDAVKNICSVLPSQKYKTECDAYIEQYGDLAIELLVNAVDPKSVCAMLGLCEDGIKLEALDDIVECAVCQGAVLALRTLQQDATVDQSEKNLLRKVCHLLPAKHFNQCKEMIDIYGISFIHLVNELIHPNMVCTRVGLCAIPDPQLNYVDYKKFQRHPIPYVGKLGSKECTWGPSYWCANKANANLCGALQHCQDKVWGQTSPLA